MILFGFIHVIQGWIETWSYGKISGNYCQRKEWNSVSISFPVFGQVCPVIASHDMSPYVRKTTALSIPKLIGLDQEQWEEAISLIGRYWKIGILMSSAEESEEDQDSDMDLKMLLKNCRPLLQLRSSGVVFPVLQLDMPIFLPIDDKTAVNSPSHHLDNAEKD